jgi:16S rRNA G966 N2-methylase RsmD
MLDQETREFIAAHRCEDPRTLALQAKRYPTVDMREAVTQIEGWQAAKDKLPAWAATNGIIYPPRISMEQCSSEATALYKAALACGGSLADLTGGFGIDCSYMARGFGKATYIERNALLCDIAKENFALLGLDHIEIVNGNSEEVLATLPHQEWIFIDPARRDGDGRKVVALSDCEPDVTALERLLLEKAHKVMVKCSPMLDITAAARQLHSIEAIHVVAVNNECKELLFILGQSKGSLAPITCTNIRKEGTQSFTFTAEEEAGATTVYSSSVGRFLYEPNAAIQKSGCTCVLSQRLHAGKLHPNSQLYTADSLIGEFPGRIFTVEKVYGFSKSEIKEIQALGQANITVRNFPDSVQLLRKKLKLADGGGNYIFATTLGDGSKAMVLCRKVNGKDEATGKLA